VKNRQHRNSSPASKELCWRR